MGHTTEATEHTLAQAARDLEARLVAAARRILKCEEEARDAVQDGYLMALRNLDRFQGASAFGTWLYRIVVNAALMRLRKRKRRRELTLACLLPDALPDTETPCAAASLERRELETLVEERIRDLPDDYREVLEIRILEGRDTNATAARLGITPQAVKTRLHRARGALRELLSPRVA